MRRFRVSISGMMWVVVASAVGIAALRDASRFSFGAIHLLSRLILGLAILLAIYRRGSARAWWLGFALFGWGYLDTIPPNSTYDAPHLPVTSVLLALRPVFGHPPQDGRRGGGESLSEFMYLAIGDDLAAMMFALLGGVLGRMIFARLSETATTEPEPTPETPSRPQWIGPVLAGWSALAVLACLAAIRATWTAGFWAGVAFLLTFGLLGILGLGAIVGRGRWGRSCLGASVLGGGYLVLVFSHSPYLPLPSGQFLHALRVWFPVLSGSTGPASARIIQELDRPIPMEFPSPTPLSEVLEYVKKSLSEPGRPEVPIYVDPLGLKFAERSLDSKITIVLRGVPLRVSLRAALRQIEMDFVVTDGLLWITSRDFYDMDSEEDPFFGNYEPHYHAEFQHRQAHLWLSADLADPYLIAGHCLLAMIGAGLGAIVGPRVAGAAESRANG